MYEPTHDKGSVTVMGTAAQGMRNGFNITEPALATTI
jgi:hypothetical protein